MIAALRGELLTVLTELKYTQKKVNPIKLPTYLKDAIKNAGRMMEMTAINLSISDQVNDGFDNSWKDHEFLSGAKKKLV